jgi:hypothetical protein
VTGKIPNTVSNPRKGQCHAKIWGDWSAHQCARKGVVESHGHLWCRQHDPRKVEARQAKAALSHRIYSATLDVKSAHNNVARVAIAAHRQEASFDDLEAAVAAYEAKERARLELVQRFDELYGKKDKGEK